MCQNIKDRATDGDDLNLIRKIYANPSGGDGDLHDKISYHVSTWTARVSD